MGLTRDEPTRETQTLAHFGYDYFAQARAAIEARRKAILAAPQPAATAPAEALTSAVGPDIMQQMNVAATVPERYQLGPGDVLTLRYWTPTQNPEEVTLRVDERGAVVLPQGGRVVARGQTLAQLEANVKKELSRKFRDLSLVLTMKELRTISVVVAGEAYAPGTYQVPAVATLFNMLYACGGPRDTGTLRAIQLRRAGGQTRRFDFYDFLLRGSTKDDVPLQPGDVLYIPQHGPRVAVRGEVFRPAIFELLNTERLHDAIRYAGGAKPTGVAQRVSIESKQPGVSRKMIDANLLDASPANNPTLFDGDVVEVLSIRDVFANLVTISGAVDQPGRYALAPAMTVCDLVERARGVMNDAYLVRADLFRLNDDGTERLVPIELAKALQRDAGANIRLQRMDRLVVYSITDVQWMGERLVAIAGAVRKPRVYARADGMRVKDLLLQAGGPTEDAVLEGAFLQRKNADGSYGPLLRIDLSKAVAGDPQHDLLLEDRDTLTVLNAAQANYIPEQTVEVTGAVQRPNRYPRGEGMRVRDLVERAGNPKPDAFLERAFLQRRNPDGTLGPLVVLDLRKTLAGDPENNPLLQDDDRLTIYALDEAVFKPRQAVTITGPVQKPDTYPRGEGMRVQDLVGLAGGVKPDAFLERAFLQRKNPDGTVGPLIPIDLGKALEEDAEHNIVLQDDDSLLVYTKEQAEFRPPQMVQILGAVQKPASYPRAEKMRLKDLLHLAGGLLPQHHDEVEIAHAWQPEGTPVTRVSAAAALRDDPQANVAIADGDVVTVHARADFVEKPATVVVRGEVKYPGPYALTGNERLSDVLKRAGGPTDRGFLDGAVLARKPELLATQEQIGLTQQVKEILEIVAREEYSRAAARAEVERLRLAATPTDPAPVKSASVLGVLQAQAQDPETRTLSPEEANAMLRHNSVSAARPLRDEDLRPLGNLQVDFVKAMRAPGGRDDLLLVDGDIITVPEKPSTVSVVGAVAMPAAAPYVPGRSASTYIRQAGGFLNDAARDRVLIIRSVGRVEPLRSGTKIAAGDIILVPTKVMATQLQGIRPALDTIFKYTTNGLLTFAVIRALTK